jgi:hypothetical protein
MKVYYQNCRGLRTKLQEFHQAVTINDFPIYCLTETWLNDGHYNYELFDERYTVIRRDRTSATFSRSTGQDIRGGGVCIAILKSTKYQIVHHNDWESQHIDDLWVSLNFTNGKRLHINCAYIPGATSSDSFETYISSITDRVMSFNGDDVILLGDQNVPEYYNESLHRGAKFESLNDMVDLCDLSQLNTHVNCLSNTVLDLVFSNSYWKLSTATEPLTKPDLFHPPLVIEKEFEIKNHNPKIKVFRNWKTANWSGIRHELFAVDWNSVLHSDLDVDTMADNFYDTTTSIFNTHCPLIVKKVKPISQKISPALKRLLAKKRKINARCRKNNDPIDREHLIQLQSECETLAEEERLAHLLSVEESLQSNPNKFWTFVNGKKSNGAGVADYVKLDEQVAESKDDAANLFASYF